MKKAVRLYVYGIVQGVGYRYFAYRMAGRLGVTGWVRNLPDGRVEVEAEGEEEVLGKFIDELKRGPRFARVRKVEERWLPYNGRYAYFTIE